MDRQPRRPLGDSISQSAFFEPSELVTVSKAEARKFGPVVAVNFELRAIGEIPAGNVMLGTVSGQCRAVQASPLPTYGTNGQLAYISGTSIRANLVYDIPAGRTLYLAGCYLVS